MDGVAGNSPDSDMETRIEAIFSPLFDDDDDGEAFPETMVEQAVQNISKELIALDSGAGAGAGGSPPESMVTGEEDDYYEEWIASILSNFTEEQFAKWAEECEEFLGYKN
nr:hypothetical protein Itr_chr08CG04360 [Ipomoea trifida]